jgi:hypothetical protein
MRSGAVRGGVPGTRVLVAAAADGVAGPALGDSDADADACASAVGWTRCTGGITLSDVDNVTATATDEETGAFGGVVRCRPTGVVVKDAGTPVLLALR